MESIQVVFEELRKKGNLEWLDKNKSRCLVMWRRPEEWGKLIYQWFYVRYRLPAGTDSKALKTKWLQTDFISLATDTYIYQLHFLAEYLAHGYSDMQVSKNGLVNSVFTLYELSKGDDTDGEEFHGLEDWMLLRSLQVLQTEGKAEIITVDDGKGVKFF